MVRFDVGSINRNKYQCMWGHDFTPENTYWYKKNGLPTRACKKCKRKKSTESKRRTRAAKRKAEKNGQRDA